MNRKYTTILAATVALFLAGGATAGDPQDAGAEDANRGDRDKRMAHRGQRESMRPEQMIRRMTHRLDLDETQAEQVRNIVASVKPEFESLREKGQAHRTAMRDLDTEDADYDAKLQDLSAARGELAALSTELRGRIRVDVDAILTPEQREKFAMAAEKGPGQRNRRGNRRPPEAQ
jgi:Spy/CpxP family protein refolding chaperone